MEPVVAPRTFSGRYEVTHLIARGGMAQVYRAQDTRLGRFVALKVLFPELSVDRTFVERFRREAQAAANLSHPNIVAVYDWGEDEGTYFIVMELINGTSLSTALREERTIPASRAAAIASQVASALAYAHRHGVVHRDIKPGNVLLTDDGQVKVTDFGIAQAVSTEEGLTMAGSVMGTAAYFSPEQAEGAVVDGRSDLYSLGVVLYEMLAGRTPFVGDSPVAVASMHVRNAPPMLRDLNPAAPVAIEQIVMKALAKDPADRYQTAEEFRADLNRFTEGVDVLAPVVLAGSAATGATSVIGAAGATSVLAQRDTTMAVPAVVAVPAAALMDGPVTDVATKRRSSGMNTALAILVVLALLLLGFFIWRGLSGASKVAVPNVVQELESVAKNQIQGAGLAVGTTTSQHSNVGVGLVFRTAPPVGTKLKPGTKVNLFVSTGAAVNVKVPAVTGQSIQAAQAALNMQKLTYQFVTVTSWTEPVIPGTVLAQSPLAGTMVTQDTPVKLTVLGSGGQYPLPDVTGLTQAAAGNTLGQYGLNVGTTSQACSSGTTSGFVASTSPSALQYVTQGTFVNLVISTGPCPVAVPNVVGFTADQARTQISNAQLSPVIQSCSTGPSTTTIASQSPPPLQMVQPGTLVTATLGCATTTTTSSTP